MQRICPVCNHALPADAHPRRRHHAGTCAQTASRAAKRRHAQRTRASAEQPKTCAWCDKPFTPKIGEGRNGNQVTCSETCRRSHRSRTERERQQRLRHTPHRPQPGSADALLPDTEWAATIHRIAQTAGPDSAAKLIAELNRHRRRNGQAEVRL